MDSTLTKALVLDLVKAYTESVLNAPPMPSQDDWRHNIITVQNMVMQAYELGVVSQGENFGDFKSPFIDDFEYVTVQAEKDDLSKLIIELHARVKKCGFKWVSQEYIKELYQVISTFRMKMHDKHLEAICNHCSDKNGL